MYKFITLGISSSIFLAGNVYAWDKAYPIANIRQEGAIMAELSKSVIKITALNKNGLTNTCVGVAIGESYVPKSYNIIIPTTCVNNPSNLAQLEFKTTDNRLFRVANISQIAKIKEWDGGSGVNGASLLSIPTTEIGPEIISSLHPVSRKYAINQRDKLFSNKIMEKDKFVLGITLINIDYSSQATMGARYSKTSLDLYPIDYHNILPAYFVINSETEFGKKSINQLQGGALFACNKIECYLMAIQNDKTFQNKDASYYGLQNINGYFPK